MRRGFLALLIGGLVLLAAWATQSVGGAVQQLGLMGFDEARAQLIAALTLGATAAAVAALVTGSRKAAALLGLIGLLAFFGPTLRQETASALRASGLAGSFDPLGYAFSLFTLALLSTAFAWAAASLALEVRRHLVRTARQAHVTWRARQNRRWALGRVVSTAMLAVALLAAFGLFAQMIDYTPDIAFTSGGPAQGGGLIGGGDLPTPDPSADPLATPVPGTSIPPATRRPGSSGSPVPSYPAVPIESGGTLSVTTGAIADLAHGHFGRRSGQMRVEHVTLPAPWTGGISTTVDIYVRLPGGYDPTKKYPTIYVTPNPYEAWQSAVRLNSTVDNLETAGDIPPMIYIFAPAVGGPHAVTQCIDSKDGLQHWDTFMSTTLIAWVDSHYSTIADAAARTIMGNSQGAYCSADLLLRHPDVWNQEISFVGFYDAAPRSPRTASGGEVFGGDQALMDAYSPIKIAPQLPTDVRKKLFFVVLGLSSQDFFGPEMDRFTGILDQNGYPRAIIETPYGHSWKTEAVFLPRALLLIGARLVKQGVLP